VKQERLRPESFSEQDLQVFDRVAREFLEEPAGLIYVVEPRITAVEVSMYYEQGSLRSVSARSGPVTTSVKTILTVPLTFVPLRKETTVPASIEICADVYMESEAFSRLNQERIAKKLPPFSDPKAAVEDSLDQTDPRVSAKRPLNYFCSGIGSNAGIRATTHHELMAALQELGLRVNKPHIHLGNGIHEVIDLCRRLKADKENFPYPVEGALIRVNSLDLEANLARISGDWRGRVVLRF
jgi:DNA ligase (NAD+)